MGIALHGDKSFYREYSVKGDEPVLDHVTGILEPHFVEGGVPSHGPQLSLIHI